MKWPMASYLVACAVFGTMQVSGASAQTFMVGGAIYTDLSNPLTSGLTGVTVTVAGTGGIFTTATIGGGQGLWWIANVPEGSYTVDATLTGYCFEHVVSRVPGAAPPIAITVDVAHQAENQSIQFLAGQECADICSDGTCGPQEDCCSCPSDCGSCCGNGICDCGETDVSCSQDCGTCAYMIGGAVYDDLASPLTSGLEGVSVSVVGTGGTFMTTTIGGGQGLWFLTDVPCGDYTVSPDRDQCSFRHVLGGVPGALPPIPITVDAAHQAENQSLQFLAECCGDGTCGAGEDSCNCLQDCAGTCCGDDICESGETSNGCPLDCFCGNATCDGDEDSCICWEDCGDRCGDGCCNGAENTCTCPQDCHDGPCCGDGACVPDEDLDNCPRDCFCGNGTCEAGDEDTCSCPADCGIFCGDGCCNEAENTCTCSDDCPGSCCGDGICEGDEHAGNCPQDCFCGNGVCEQGEDACNCPVECAGTCSGLGACCLPDPPECVDEFNELECLLFGGKFLGEDTICDDDADHDGVLTCRDVCPNTLSPAGVDFEGRPLGDLDRDCDVDLNDYSIMQRNFTGP